MIGQRFGMLIVTDGPVRIPNGSQMQRAWVCRCDCGQDKTVPTSRLNLGRTRSCGCLLSITAKATRARLPKQPRHGMCGTPTYGTWYSMLQRCTNPRNKRWADYGGRGIAVCQRWFLFDNFFADMGERPPGKTIDRIDVNGNYEPGNCRWATASEQRVNQRTKGA